MCVVEGGAALVGSCYIMCNILRGEVYLWLFIFKGKHPQVLVLWGVNKLSVITKVFLFHDDSVSFFWAPVVHVVNCDPTEFKLKHSWD